MSFCWAAERKATCCIGVDLEFKIRRFKYVILAGKKEEQEKDGMTLLFSIDEKSKQKNLG